MRAPEKGLTRELQVGIFVFTAILVIAAFSFRITDSPIFRRGTRVSVFLKDATGIFKNSKVKMAGIDIGAISTIELSGGRAKITFVINSGVELPTKVIVVPKPLGILGDKYLEIILPGKDADIIEENGVELKSNEKPQSFLHWPKLFEFISEAHAQDQMPESVKSMPRVKSGDVLKAVDAPTTIDDIARQLGSVSQDLKVISKDIRVLVNENREKIGQSVEYLNRILGKLDRSLEGVDDKKISQSIAKLNNAVDSFQNSVERVNNITRKIDDGQGSVGKLINDAETVDQVNRTLSNINAALDRAKRTQAFVDATTEYNFMPKANKTYFGVAFMPSEETGYLGALVVDEAGTSEKKIETVTTNGGAPTVVETETRKPYKFRYSLQFLKRLGRYGARVGLFESKGGVAVDTFFWGERIHSSLEFFDFAREANNPYLKFTTTMALLQYFYLSVGGSDLISKYHSGASRSSVFAGVGLRFTDSDLKTLLALPGIP
jgi:phospholipid/cholesterol/gamma-HCH transport system substrate-binding protein